MTRRAPRTKIFSRRFPRLDSRLRRRTFFLERLEDRSLLATVMTDKPDYAPGETADISASGFQIGEAVQFQVLHTDGTPNTGNGHHPWSVVDGGPTDLDGQVDGNIDTAWYVDPDDSGGSAFELTATGSSGLVAKTNFTDSVNVTAATGGTGLTNLTYNTLGNIVINEENDNDIPGVVGAPRTLILTAPTGLGI